MLQPEERRGHERYEMVLPCMISIAEDHVDSKLIEGNAMNISGGGILIDGFSGSVVGAKVKVHIVIPQKIAKTTEGCGTHISANGSVVRLEDDGFAVSFSEDYRVASLDRVLRLMDRKRAWLAGQLKKGLAEIQTNASGASSEGSIKDLWHGRDIPVDSPKNERGNAAAEAKKTNVYAL